MKKKLIIFSIFLFYDFIIAMENKNQTILCRGSTLLKGEKKDRSKQNIIENFFITSRVKSNQDNYHNKIEIKKTIITLPKLNAFISEALTFEDIFIAALKKLTTENSNVVIIDIDSFLEKIKPQINDNFLETKIERLIHKSIYDIINNNTLNLQNILFKYTKFYYNIINDEINRYHDNHHYNENIRINFLNNIAKYIKYFKTYENNIIIPDDTYKNYPNVDFDAIYTDNIDMIHTIKNDHKKKLENIKDHQKQKASKSSNNIYQITFPIDTIPLERNDLIKLININKTKKRINLNNQEIENSFAYKKKFSPVLFRILVALGSSLGIIIPLIIILKYDFNTTTNTI
jgi:hypothetical protein